MMVAPPTMSLFAASLLNIGGKRMWPQLELVAEIAHNGVEPPFRREEQDGPTEGVAHRPDVEQLIGVACLVHRVPSSESPPSARVCDALKGHIDTVLVGHAACHHLKLQGADGGQYGHAAASLFASLSEHLHGSLGNELLQALIEVLGLRRRGAEAARKDLGREGGDLCKRDALGSGVDRISDRQQPLLVRQPNDVPRVSDAVLV
mmetsp:Transcript_29068/g.58604  ORF Transcript_29068/g.58604 Transcript_29068/m.58604 type:complete len:205 (+) Transcript_29068:161-775(+)